MTIICELDPTTLTALHSAIGEAGLTPSLEQLRHHLDSGGGEDTVVIGPSVDLGEALRLAEVMRVVRPTLGVVLVRQRIDTGVLGDALRAGVREVVDARDLAGLHAAVRRSQAVSAALTDRLAAGGAAPPRPEGRAPGRIVTVFSAKGGCGKTTLATNMAAALADRGRREVCLVDLDLAFGDVAISLHLFPAHTVADVVPLGETVDVTAIASLLTPHSPGLTTLVAPVEPGGSEAIPAALVGHVLSLLRTQFDYVVVDTPPAFDDQVLTAFDLSDVVCLLATLDIPALKNLKLALETMELLRYPRERWRIVLNRADSKVGLSLGEVQKTLRTTISAHIPSSRDVPAAINRGVPIVLDDPKHPVSVAIRTFAEREVAGPGRAHPLDAVLAGRSGGDRRTLRRWRARA
ncbi:MAG TPA: AAA family ATPase [Kineosporiaceae bacterium]